MPSKFPYKLIIVLLLRLSISCSLAEVRETSQIAKISSRQSNKTTRPNGSASNIEHENASSETSSYNKIIQKEQPPTTGHSTTTIMTNRNNEVYPSPSFSTKLASTMRAPWFIMIAVVLALALVSVIIICIGAWVWRKKRRHRGVRKRKIIPPRIDQSFDPAKTDVGQDSDSIQIQPKRLKEKKTPKSRP